ncbi:hypothetical protein QYM36_009775 [Artemia franciscana]|uniref:Uncharacterized protein n=1 Tax=Artemia franciscana TaxID=6661 RepID=A0AA88HXI0_ARTSF|nr:hypothetical protein QYM36_009775 [Artemia franciscana]
MDDGENAAPKIRVIPPYNPFTRESMIKIEQRKAEELAKKNEKKRRREEGEVRVLKNNLCLMQIELSSDSVQQ